MLVRLAAILIPLVLHTAAAATACESSGKFLGSAFSAAQAPGFATYWNKVTPENGGKWGRVEATRDVMDWSALDQAYALAREHGFPIQMHVLVWGNQQPAWIEDLPAQEQLEELREWFAAVAARYPQLDFVEVVNEPLHDPPNQRGQGGGNYFDALGGTGASGWDWVLNAFRMARGYFPHAQLMINDYDITNDSAATQRYRQIIELLQSERLIDAIGVQGHAFTTRADIPMATHIANLDALAVTGLPIYVTELDVDGPTDEAQLQDYRRIFPGFWEHPAVRGITLWGFRSPVWRNAQGAYLVHSDGSERPALRWLQQYVRGKSGCASAAQIGSIERFDPALDAILAPGTQVERLAEGFDWAEGPVWIRAGGYLLFTDVPANTLYRWSASDGPSVFLKPSGYEGRDPAGLREPGANGLIVADDRAILMADSGNRAIARLALDGRRKTMLATHFAGKRFNSPNDLARRADGTIFFTDPPYGLEGLNASPRKELDFNGVYRLAPDGTVAVIDRSLSFPNGIELSPDERVLFVSNSDPQRPVWIAYDLNAAGESSGKRIFADASDLIAADSPGLPDGMAMSADGHLFATAPGGVLVFASDGRRLGRIRTGAAVANCAVGDDGRTLYMTSDNMLARVKLRRDSR
jgi:endo-1,4-beta-xylanase